MLNAKIINQVGLITLARPWAYNVLNDYMMREMMKILDAWQGDHQVKMIMITGEGDIFCYGTDLGIDVEEACLLENWGKLLNLIYRFPKLTVALINGKTRDTGCELAAVCDFRLAHPDVILCFEHHSHRLTSNIDHVHYLFDRLPYPKGLELLVTGKEINSSEAYSIGFINKIIPKSNFLEEAINWCESFTRRNLELLLQYKQAALKSRHR